MDLFLMEIPHIIALKGGLGFAFPPDSDLTFLNDMIDTVRKWIWCHRVLRCKCVTHKNEFPVSQRPCHHSSTQKHTFCSCPSHPSPPSSSHSAHWIIFNPSHVKLHVRQKPPYGHRQPPPFVFVFLSAHIYNAAHVSFDGYQRGTCRAGCIGCHCSDLCRATCVESSPVRTAAGRRGNPIWLIDKHKLFT